MAHSAKEKCLTHTDSLALFLFDYLKPGALPQAGIERAFSAYTVGTQ